MTADAIEVPKTLFAPQVRDRRDLWRYVVRMTVLVLMFANSLLIGIDTLFGLGIELRTILVTSLMSIIISTVISHDVGRTHLALWHVTQRLREAVRRDLQTGLINHLSFMTELATNLAPDRPGILLVADIDHFKQINDRCGHQTGDAVIAEFAALTRRCFGQNAMIGRLGGEEFAVYLKPPFLTLDTAERLGRATAETWRTAVALQPFGSDGTPIEVTASIGIAVFDGHGSLQQLYSRADKALYRAKALGRNRSEVAPPAAAGHEFALTETDDLYFDDAAAGSRPPGPMARAG